VNIRDSLRAKLRASAPLRVAAVDAPPLVRYDAKRGTYEGIAIDVLCLIAAELGISFEIAPGRDQTVYDKLRQVQTGQADLFIPLSHSAERAEAGLFTNTFYNSYYAVIARQGSGVVLRGINDLSNYRVGYLPGAALEPLLKATVPPDRLFTFNERSSNGLFDVVRKGTVDVAVFNKDVFQEKRYHNEYFDLEVIYTVYESPRAYRFYFSKAPDHALLVDAFNRYLAAVDISASVDAHQDGERVLLERYVKQRNQRSLLLYACITGVALLAVVSVALQRHRRLTRLLNEKNRYIERQRSALHEANQKLERLTRTDSLTELPNRRSFDEGLAAAYARYRATGTPLSLLAIDVDRFKRINDEYGHLTGDSYLRSVARSLERSVDRQGAHLARYGGEEFVCLLPATPAQSACQLAEQIRRDIEQLRLPNAAATPPWVTVSVGVATVEAGDPGAETLVEVADAQLYLAKERGRNQVRAAIV